MGRRTEENKITREEIARISEENNWSYCFLSFPGCQGEAAAPAHRHERRWYYDKPQGSLALVEQWIPACTRCHHTLDKVMTKEQREWVFSKIRGVETI